jgi:hypothetical protein
MKNIIRFVMISLFAIACGQKKGNVQDAVHLPYKGTGAITQGIAKTTTQNLFECDQVGSRIAALGEIKDQTGKVWIVPGDNSYKQGTKAFDLYNDCTRTTPDNLSMVDLNSVPITELDKEGEIITGFIFADNYFELFINGQLIAVDPVPFTPFNSSVVKFKVTRPYSIAVKLIDWEENLGVGSEKFQGALYHAGDGGFIASFSDGTITNSRWKAQTFYTAPIRDLNCLSEVNQQRVSSNCNTEDAVDGSNFYGVHWEIPEDWYKADFDDSKWPDATTYSDKTIGVDNKKAYMNFIEKFSGSGAEFIWSTNVVLDNEVIVRYTVK